MKALDELNEVFFGSGSGFRPRGLTMCLNNMFINSAFVEVVGHEDKAESRQGG